METIKDFVSKHNKNIESHYNQLKSKNKNPEAEEEFVKHFISLAKELQNLMGLSDENQMPGFLKGFINEAFLTQIPFLLAQNYQKILVPLAGLYEAIEKPPRDFVDSELDDVSNGKKIASQCRKAGSSAATQIPAFLKKQHRMLGDNAAEKIAGGFPGIKNTLYEMVKTALGIKDSQQLNQPGALDKNKLLEQTYSLKEWARNWVSTNMLALGESKDSRVKNLWRFIETTVNNGLAHIVAQSPNDQAQTKLSSILTNKFFNLFFNFADTHGQKITKLYAELKESEINPETNVHFIALFQPLCDQFLLEIGLGEGNEFPLPDIFNQTAKWFFRESAARLLASQYKQCLVPKESIEIIVFNCNQC